jgi:hypothetical protein
MSLQFNYDEMWFDEFCRAHFWQGGKKLMHVVERYRSWIAIIDCFHVLIRAVLYVQQTSHKTMKDPDMWTYDDISDILMVSEYYSICES